MGEAIKTDMNLLYYLMWKTEIQMEIRMREICHALIRRAD